MMIQAHYLRISDLKQITGLSRSTILRLESLDKFPKRRRPSTHAVGWLSTEVQEWLSTRNQIKQSRSPTKFYEKSKTGLL